MSLRTLAIAAVLIASSPLAVAAVINVPADKPTPADAMAVARKGDAVRIRAGEYQGAFTVPDGVALVGGDPKECILNMRRAEHGVTVQGNARMEGVTIRKGKTGIYLAAGASLEIANCHILDNKEDGIGFDSAFNTQLRMHDCVVSGNGDGVDLESTQAMIVRCRFTGNRDDGLDLDGDAGLFAYDCDFLDNRDDGTEIRIAATAHAIFQSCRFGGNGEDGIEVINSPAPRGVFNILCVQNCTFDANKRFGVGFVVQDKEVATDQMSKTAVYAAGNTFTNAGKGDVSANYASVFTADASYPDSCAVTLTQGDEEKKTEIPVKIPLLMAVYNLRPTTDGTMGLDAEGVTVHKGVVWVADDDRKTIYGLDRTTGCVKHSFKTTPLPGSDFNVSGPEGLDILAEDGKSYLLLSDDEGQACYVLSLDQGNLGHVVRRLDATRLGTCEGIEVADDAEWIVVSGSKLHRVKSANLEAVGEPVALACYGFGTHFSGVGTAENGFVTSVTGYTGTSQTWRNHAGAVLELDRSLSEIRELQHLGPFSNDPRGVTVADGLMYVVDGRVDFRDSETGETNRGGVKVFVLLADDSPRRILESLPLLPIRAKP